MLTHTKSLSPSLKNPGQKTFHDPEFVDFKGWLAIPYLEGKGLQEIRHKEFTLYLNHFPDAPLNHQAQVHSAISLKNNSDFSLLNFKIIFKEKQKEVFYLNELAPNKMIQLKLIKEGFFHLYYSSAHSQKIEKRIIKIILKSNEKLDGPHNFHSKLKPPWF